MSSSSSPADPVFVGRIIRPRGLIGEVIVEPLSDHPSRFEAGAELWLDEISLTVTRARPDKERWVLSFEGITSRDEAEKLRGGELVVDASSLPSLDEDSYYFHDLVDCCLEDPRGTHLGTVTGVVPGTPGWLEVDHDGKTALVPMVRVFFLEVDLAGKRIVIDPPTGLLEASGMAGEGGADEEVSGAATAGDRTKRSKRAEVDAV